MGISLSLSLLKCSHHSPTMGQLVFARVGSGYVGELHLLEINFRLESNIKVPAGQGHICMCGGSAAGRIWMISAGGHEDGMMLHEEYYTESWYVMLQVSTRRCQMCNSRCALSASGSRALKPGRGQSAAPRHPWTQPDVQYRLHVTGLRVLGEFKC